jgi:DNA-nicking Smr family endonuclease
MEDSDDNSSFLAELKSHYKEFSSDVIETLYEANGKDISKTIDALIENQKIQQLYNNNKDNDNNNSNNNNNEIEEIEDKNEINENIEENDEEEDDYNDEGDEIDDNLLKFLIEIAPFNTAEEIIEKIIEYNHDIDRVISSLLSEEVKEKSIDKKNDENKFNNLKNLYNSSIGNDINYRRKRKRGERKKGKKYRKNNGNNTETFRKYSEYKVLEFLEKNKNNWRIDLHGFKLSESMIIVKKKLEEMENLVKIKKRDILLIIVTGRGNHSPDNKPVLRPNILRFLKSRKYDINERDPGALYVTIKYSQS